MAALSVSIFSLAVLFMGTFAWFTAYRDQQLATQSPFDVRANAAAFKQLTIHELDEDNSTASTYKFYADPTGTLDGYGSYSGSPVDFGVYTQSDRAHPLLLIFEFSSELHPTASNPTSITAKTEETFVADGELDEHGDPEIKLDQTDNPLSSIVNFKSFSYPSNQAGDITGISTYNSTDDTFDYTVASLADAESFVEIDNTGINLEYDDFDDEKTLFTASSGSIKYVAIVFNYYGDALDYIYSYYMGTPALEYEYIYFICDWTMLIV